jgi:2-polyprenyl-3-methyl-5-hydroxy-6-metoxy-1,4-benzoquinol methylase
MTNHTPPPHQRTCPVWVGYTMLIPLRRLQHNPVKILKPYVREGMKVMDYGPAMGYFSIPLAKLVGSQGKVYCVDIQAQMLEKLRQRALKFGVGQTIETRLVGSDYNPEELKGQLDVVLLFFVVHEVPDKAALFRDIRSMLKPRGKVIFAEPKGHVSESAFNLSLSIARQAGFTVSHEKPVKRGWSALLEIG